MASGYIQYKIETGGGKDPETGFDLPVEVSWSEPIDCTFQPNHSSTKGAYEDGSFTSSQYDINIEAQELPSFDAIRLFDSRGNQLGTDRNVENREFAVFAPLEYLELVNRIKIIV